MKTKTKQPTAPKKRLYDKYRVSKADGTPTHSLAEYFVLRLDRHCEDKKHTEACRTAVFAYARAMRGVEPLLSNDIFDKFTPLLYTAQDFIDAGFNETGDAVTPFIMDICGPIERHDLENTVLCWGIVGNDWKFSIVGDFGTIVLETLTISEAKHFAFMIESIYPSKK